MGFAIAISRRDPAPIVGHIGWAIEMPDGSFFAGSTERFVRSGVNWADLGHIDAGQNNDAWAELFKTQSDMLEAFASTEPNGHEPYTWWKAYDVANPNFEAARQQGIANAQRGWDLIGNNCLDHATDVLALYGVPWQQLGGSPADGMPWKGTNPTPVGWLNAWQLPLHIL